MSATIGTGERGTIRRKSLCRCGLVAGAPDDVRPGSRQRVDLREGAVDIGCLGGRHRLHRDRGSTADGDRPYVDLPGLAAFRRILALRHLLLFTLPFCRVPRLHLAVSGVWQSAVVD